MIAKHPIVAQRIRKVPVGFSWIDHRLVREHFIDRCSHAACALYLFLVTVADAKGLSHYSDLSLKQRLGMDQTTLEQARSQLIRIDLIAWQTPLYQVLSLEVQRRRPSSGALMSLGEILRAAAAREVS